MVGQEKESQDYVNSMREVKGNKSMDTFEIMARLCGLQNMFKLLQPLESLLLGNLSPKNARQADEVLRRIGLGLAQNSSANSRDMLTLAYQLTQKVHNLRQKQLANGSGARKPTTDRAIVQPMTDRKSYKVPSSSHLFKITRFALDNVRSTLQKHEELLNGQNLHGFVPIIGDALLEGEESVKISAMRLLSAIIKLPMKELDEASALYILEAIKVIKAAVSTNTESSQAALKLLASILRERQTAEIRDS